MKFLSAIGNDTLGEDALKALYDFGVSTKYVKRAEQPTGQCIVTLDENVVPNK